MSDVKGHTNTARAVNVTPDGWYTSPLSEVCSMIRDGTHLPPKRIASGIPLLSIRNMKNGRFMLLDDDTYVSKDFYEKMHSKWKPESGDLLLAVVGATVGKVCQVPADFPVFTLQRSVAVIRTNENIFDKNFLYAYSQSKPFKDRLWDRVNQTAQPGIYLAEIGKILTPIPPLPEQQKIAAILSSVDEVIEKTQAQINKLKDLKIGMMQELLSPREGQAANISNPQGESKNGLHHTEFKDSPLGRIPVGWETLSLENLVHRIIDCEHKTAPYIDKSEFLVVRTSNVRHGELVHKDIKFTTESGFSEWTKRAIPSVGDVLFTREAPAGESCMVPEGIKVCMGQRMVLLRPNKDLVDPNYFSLFLTSEFAELAIYELSIGTTVNRINIEDIKKIPYILPPKSEQKKIHSIVQSIQKTLTTKQSKLKSLLDTKKALMQDLLTGKVRVKVDAA
jgi:type I restriction enzyme S subunit